MIEELQQIRLSQQMIKDIERDIADQWKVIGNLLREKRRSKCLTQTDAGALLGRDASIVCRWENGCAVDVAEVLEYHNKLEQI
jgi:ribosome-binding protein aMBF1 (putative translation factor)